MDWLIEVLISVFPDFFEGITDTIEVVVTAIPDFGIGAVGIFGAVGFVIMFGIDYLVNGGEV